MVQSTEIDLLEWPSTQTVYLTLDLECDYGTALEVNKYKAARRTADLASILESYGAPLTCFLQTEVLERAPEAVNALQTADIPVEFHAHSHTHPSRSQADIEYEISESVRRIATEFGSEQIGFRFPDGAAEEGDYQILSDHDVVFSSSLFPSWRPGRFNNTDQPRSPFRHRPSGVFEFPFTVHSQIVRVPISISYLKFFGRSFEWLVRQSTPDVIVFDMHMHDLFVPSTFSRLSPRYQLIYSRRKHAGPTVLKRFIRTMNKKDYTFERLTGLYSTITTDD